MKYSDNWHEKQANAERAQLDRFIRREGDDLAKHCEAKGLTDDLVKATQRGYWSM